MSFILNPFRYGKPVPPAQFIGREDVVRTIFARILNAESSAIVGPPHIGKSSLLRYIRDERVREDWIGSATKIQVFVDIDCHLLPIAYQPEDFWREVLEHIERIFVDDEVKSLIEIVRRSNYGSFVLKGMLDRLGRDGKQVVLLIDEFDVLQQHPNFNTAEFFGALRSLSIQTNALVLLIASRLPVAEMNQLSYQINPLGSPFFNHLIEVQLRPLRSSEVNELIDRTLEKTGIAFSSEDRSYIMRMTGGDPLLTQMTAAALFEAYSLGVISDALRADVARNVQSRAIAHFEDLWRFLDPEQQTVMVALTLAELKGNVDRQDTELSDFFPGDTYGSTLRFLTAWGLVEQPDETSRYDYAGYFAKWQGRYWRIAAGWMVQWLRENNFKKQASVAPLQDIDIPNFRTDNPEALPQLFLMQAGFSVRRVDRYGMLCSSDAPLWSDVSLLYVRQVLQRTLNFDEFQALCVAARAVQPENSRDLVAAVLIDQSPRASDLYQIFALRAQERITIIPLPYSLLTQARIDSREMEALRDQIDLYTGRTDLYDMRTAVSDILSFFGRSALLADLQRRLTSGRSAMVIGVRKMGKSSLMGRLREECSWPTAVVDLQGYVGGLRYVYDEALRGWSAAIAASFPELTPPVISPVPADTSAAEAQRFRQAVGELLDVLARQPNRPGLLLFLDEADILFGQAEYADFAAVLRGLAESPRYRGRFALLAVGTDPLINRADRMDALRNPFFSFFSETPLGPLELDDSRAMIVSIGGQMGIDYTNEALALLVEAGGGHPFLTRQICSQAISGLERPATIDAEHATQAIETYLRAARNYLAESLWGLDSGGPPAAEATLLRLLATAEAEAEEILIPPDCAADEQRARQLARDHLHDQRLIRHNADGWELTIPLYRNWIRRYILHIM